MTLWILLFVLLVLVTAACWWMLTRVQEPAPRDPDWGDWPSDQRQR